MDIATPRNVQLSGFYRRSNAVLNAQQKIPNCLMAISNELNSRLLDVKQQYGEDAAEELKEIITKIQSLRDEVLADVPFRKLNSSGPDVKFYNDYLEKMTCQDCRPTMLQTVRIYSECYVYRRIWECFELSKNLNQFDPYGHLKAELLTNNLTLLKKMAKFMINLQDNPSEEKFTDFDKLIRLNLWSNTPDRPLKQEYLKDRLRNLRDIDLDDAYILRNDSRLAWKLLSDFSSVMDSNLIVDFVLDNSGYELFLDFCLADFIMANTPVTKVRFHVKSIPWFIWNTTEYDTEHLLNRMKQISKIYIQTSVSKWINYIEKEKWQIVVRKFWSLPNNFREMIRLDPWLYNTLSESTLIIMKGDYNYLKTVGDYNWNPQTPFEKTLEQFHPSNILFVRVLRTDIVCGLNEEEEERVEILNRNICRGHMGIIQFVGKKSDPVCLLE